MICPHCKNSMHIEIDTHPDGFAPNLQECGDCGTLWTTQKDEKEILIHGPTSEMAIND